MKHLFPTRPSLVALLLLSAVATSVAVAASCRNYSSSSWTPVARRNLRGSSGGSRGSRGNRGSRDQAGEMPLWGALIIVDVFAAVLLCFGGSLCMACFRVNKFDKLVQDAKVHVEYHQVLGDKRMSPPSHHQTKYDFTYEEDDDVGPIQCCRSGEPTGSGTLILHFIKNGHGYDISGTGSYINVGETKIVEGRVNTINGLAFWHEEKAVHSSNDEPCLNELYNHCNKLKILSQGTFDFDSNTFVGSWTTNTGIAGKYTSFQDGHDDSKGDVDEDEL